MADYTENLIPTMTSNTTPSGVVSASTIAGSSNDAWKAFDGITSSGQGWRTASGILVGWIQYKFNDPKKIRKYIITGDSNAPCSPKSWTFEGSNDGSSWAVLDTQNNIINWSNYESREFVISNSMGYLHYRLNITLNNGNTTATGILEIKMMEIKYSNKILLSSEGKVYSAISYDPIDVIPTMTSNTAPSGTVSASSASTSGTEYRVFDKNKTNTWLTASGQKTGWIQYKFPSMARVNRYGITPQSSALTRSPKKWSLLGSNTGLFNGEEVVLDSRINETSWSAGTKYFDFNNNSEYQYYRLSIEENNGDTSYVGFNELEFLQRADMKLVKLSSPSEKNFIQYGSSTVQFGNLTSMVDVNDSGRDLGSGKTYQHSIDMSKRRVDKITLG